MSKIAGIEFLKEQLIAVENEKKKLQAALARLPQLDAEVQAIKLLLAKHAGETNQLPLSSQEARTVSPVNAGTSISKLIVRALTEAGKPQRTEQLLAFLASHGRPTHGHTLRSTIHQSKIIKSVTPGLYGLTEWAQER
jgi:hypothetical protein